MVSQKIINITSDALELSQEGVKVTNEQILRDEVILDLVWEAVFGKPENKQGARWVIWESALELNIVPSSINDFYMARGREETPLDFTVPAINIRTIAFDMSESIFSVAKEMDAGAVICEIARSEMGYTYQSPEEYTAVILAGAIRAGWDKPVFIQGDHIQTKAAEPGVPKEGEIESIKKVIQEIISAGFYNIDIDTSTLVNLEKQTVKEQQESNIKYSIEFANYVREKEPKEITISIGGEIGHIGGKNSTVEDFETYIEGFNAGISKEMTGISKISVQTGTSHGGVVLDDGTLAEINVDFNVLSDISKVCRDKYGISGSVQHGASTLPDEYFKNFPKAQAVEIHLATGFQNLILDHDEFPSDLLDDMYEWVDENKQSEKKEDWTEEQFHYKLRKKALGPFKKDLWAMNSRNKIAIKKTLEERLRFLFTALNISGTSEYIDKFIKPVKIHKKIGDFGGTSVTSIEVVGLSD